MGILLQFPSPPETRPAPVPLTPLRQHQLTAWQCLSYPELVTDWERAFLSTVRETRHLSDAQQATLNAIASKVERGRK